MGLSFGGWLLYGKYTSMSELSIENPEMPIGPLPLTLDNKGYLTPDMPFRIDFGASCNTITPEYLERMKARGMVVDSMIVPTIAYTVITGSRLTMKRYRASLPVYNYEIKIDSAGIISSKVDTTNIVNWVNNIDFVLTSDGPDYPRLGLPFIKKFKVEFDYSIHSVIFHRQIPKSDYVGVADLQKGWSLFKESPYYLSLTVNRKAEKYYLNSAMPRVGIVMPSSLAPAVDNEHVFADTINSISGDYPAIIAYNGWVELGDRAGERAVAFSDYGTQSHGVNPFLFHSQDAIYDLENQKLYMRRTAVYEPTRRDTDLFVRLF